jgi:DNA mismatch repair protein MutH
MSECNHEDPDHTGQCIKCQEVLDPPFETDHTKAWGEGKQDEPIYYNPTPEEREKIKEQFEDYMNGLHRYKVLGGLRMKEVTIQDFGAIAPQIYEDDDPKPDVVVG